MDALKSSITINEISQFSTLKLYKFTLQTRRTYWSNNLSKKPKYLEKST